MKKIHIIGAHTDDEVLGVGGTISELTDKGYEFFVTILGKPIIGKYPLNPSKEELQQIKEKNNRVEQNVKNVSKILGIKEVSLHDFPNCQYDSVKQLELTQAIERDMKKFKPNLIFTHSPYDSNTDHLMVNRSVIIATRSLPNCNLEGVFMYEVPSSTTYGRVGIPFKPDTYVKISEEALSKKIKAMEGYETEKQPYPHPRSPEALKALAMFRGTEIGHKYAEAFETIWRKGL